MVYDLRVEGEPEAIGVTGGHPVWSVDRGVWVSVSELAVGERVSTACGGVAAVLGIDPRGEEPVYNLEVDADHCYRVGRQGILVHNASDQSPICEPECEKVGKTRRATITNKNGTYKFTFDKCRTVTAEGPIAAIPEGFDDRDKYAQTAMLDLFFGKGKLASPLRVPAPPQVRCRPFDRKSNWWSR